MPIRPVVPGLRPDGLYATLEAGQIGSMMHEELAATPIIDIHTHSFMPSLRKLALWGMDELLAYHYLQAELFRSSQIMPTEY